MKKVLTILSFAVIVTVSAGVSARAYNITWYCACCEGGRCASTTAGGCESSDSTCASNGQTVTTSSDSDESASSQCVCSAISDGGGDYDDYEHLIKGKVNVLEGHQTPRGNVQEFYDKKTGVKTLIEISPTRK